MAKTPSNIETGPSEEAAAKPKAAVMPKVVTKSFRQPAAWDLFRLPAYRRLLLVNLALSAGWDAHSSPKCSATRSRSSARATTRPASPPRVAAACSATTAAYWA